MSHHKIFVIVGPNGAGGSTVAATIQATPLDGLVERFRDTRRPGGLGRRLRAGLPARRRNPASDLAGRHLVRHAAGRPFNREVRGVVEDRCSRGARAVNMAVRRGPFAEAQPTFETVTFGEVRGPERAASRRG